MRLQYLISVILNVECTFHFRVILLFLAVSTESPSFLFQLGDNIRRNKTRAIELFHRLAEKGNPVGQQVFRIYIPIQGYSWSIAKQYWKPNQKQFLHKLQNGI